MEALIGQLAVLLIIIVAFAFILGGARGGRALLGCLFAPIQGCLRSVIAAVLGIALLALLLTMAWHGVRERLGGGGDGTPPQERPDSPPSLPKPGPKVPLPTRFDYPVGAEDADGRHTGAGWYVSQDFADTVNPYSAARSGQHLGEDWLVSRNKRKNGSFAKEPVYAIADGVVIRACKDKSYGHVVMIKHPMPEGSDPPYVVSLYGHLGSDDVVAEQTTDDTGTHPTKVTRGQMIGRIGKKGDNGVSASDGEAWPEHLHFEIRRPSHEFEDNWVAYGYSAEHDDFLNPTDATSDGNTPGGGWIDAYR